MAVVDDADGESFMDHERCRSTILPIPVGSPFLSKEPSRDPKMMFWFTDEQDFSDAEPRVPSVPLHVAE